MGKWVSARKCLCLVEHTTGYWFSSSELDWFISIISMKVPQNGFLPNSGEGLDTWIHCWILIIFFSFCYINICFLLWMFVWIVILEILDDFNWFWCIDASVLFLFKTSDFAWNSGFWYIQYLIVMFFLIFTI